MAELRIFSDLWINYGHLPRTLIKLNKTACVLTVLSN